MAGNRFPDLRGLRWRIDLGILPRTGSVDDLRRVTADSRRKYANLRRRLLVDPHLSKDVDSSANLVLDNPLSQNPESTWGRFFKNAEMEQVINQDLSRLYPENGSYFQSSACQIMLRRILKLWCLLHSEHGYRQGMHELLAPLVYVLHVDLDHLSHLRKMHKDCFNGELDDVSFLEDISLSKVRKTNIWEIVDKQSNLDDRSKSCNLDELDTETRDILLLCDSYGAESELGVVVSERFMEHDAYCMFEALMSGGTCVVAMGDFFQHSAIGSSSTVPPVIEASSALYHLLSIIDSSLHSHLVDLGVEPQYFALRWLRVLFGREFCLNDLLVIWDEIFSSPNVACIEKDAEYSFKILCCPRGAFIAALAVSMLLYLRSTLLATEHATSCLQRLLNFPKNPDLKKLIEKAKVYQVIAIESNISSSSDRNFTNSAMTMIRGYSLPSGPVRSKTPAKSVLDSYWEEKWRLLQANETLKNSNNDLPSKGRMKKSWGEKLSLSRTESAPSRGTTSLRNDPQISVRRNLLDDFSRDVSPVGNIINHEQKEEQVISEDVESLHLEANDTEQCMEERTDQNAAARTSGSTIEETLSGEISSIFSGPSSPLSQINDNGNESDKSSTTSNSTAIINNEEMSNENCSQSYDHLAVQTSEIDASTSVKNGNQEELSKERKPFGGKFLWFWKFNKGSSEENNEKLGSQKSEKLSVPLPADERKKMDVPEKKLTGTLRNLGQSMHESIQVIESIFHQDRGQPSSLENLSNSIIGGKGRVAAMNALKELQTISNLLLEM